MPNSQNVKAEPADIALGIAQAIISSSNTPLLLLSDTLVVLAASRSFCRAFNIETAVDLRLPDLGTGEWNVPQLTALLLAAATGPLSVDNYEMSLQRPGQPVRQLIVNAHRLDFEHDDRIMVLLSILDNTDTLALEKQRTSLVKEKALLLEELQHRVANSLQIIASVLLQSAKGVPAGDTRAFIFDAHARVMSVASLQHQLALSPRETVTLQIYFSNLCRSIGASMIADEGKLKIVVDVDGSKVAANVSLCLGLMLTELVINALKHAFPNERTGVITVSFRSREKDWTMTVSDNGVGMPADMPASKAGLGSSIVQALAVQIDAMIAVTAGQPGTVVTVRHREEIDVQSALPV